VAGSTPATVAEYFLPDLPTRRSPVETATAEAFRARITSPERCTFARESRNAPPRRSSASGRAPSAHRARGTRPALPPRVREHTPIALHSARDEPPQRSGLVLAIGLFKLAKAALLFVLAGLTILAVRRTPLGLIDPWIDALRIDPDNHFFRVAVARVVRLSNERMALYAAGSVFYGIVFLVEGVGLTLRRRWAEWLTVVVTASFVPLEAYELARRFTVARVVLIVLNLGILAYLLVRRLTERGERRARTRGARSR
jgi:uncharacterized membrane protein (DUF2068 family)